MYSNKGIENYSTIQNINIYFDIFKTNIHLTRYQKRNVSIFYFHNCIAITVVPPRYMLLRVVYLYFLTHTSRKRIRAP